MTHIANARSVMAINNNFFWRVLLIITPPINVTVESCFFNSFNGIYEGGNDSINIIPTLLSNGAPLFVVGGRGASNCRNKYRKTSFSLKTFV